MAPKKPVSNHPQEAVPKSKKKIGPTELATITTALEKLRVITGKLQGIASVLEKAKLNEITMEGPVVGEFRVAECFGRTYPKTLDTSSSRDYRQRCWLLTVIRHPAFSQAMK